MNHNTARESSFPTVPPESQHVFLNSRHGTQIPESIIQSIVQSLNSGISWKNDDGTVEIRQKLAAFLHVDAPDTIFFSESEAGMIYWLAYCWGFSQLQDGDEVILSSQDTSLVKETFDHVQRQMAQRGMTLVIKDFGYQENGEFDLKELLSLLSPKTRLIFVPHIHPVFGTKNENDIAFLKQHVGDQALVVVDLTQSIGRIPVDLEHLRCDCAFFSAHNLFSPFPLSIGYRRPGLAGDQNIFLSQELANPVAARTLGQGIEMVEQIGREQIALHLHALSHALLTRLQEIDTLEFLPGIGRCEEWCSPGYGILSFQLPGVSAEECRLFLAENALLVDLADLSGYPDAVTISLQIYNTTWHINALGDCLHHLCT